MIALAAGLLLTLALDQAIKILVLRRLERASVPLAGLGRLQVVRSRMWLTGDWFRFHLAVVWIVWFLAAASLSVLTFFIPSCGWFVGVLLGGSLSHVTETTLRGCVVDYVRLRFWPAFNLADLAITVGSLGILVNMIITTSV